MPHATEFQPFPPDFRTQDIQTNGTTLHVRVSGDGPAVVLLHGYGETGDMWASMAADLMRDHRVIVPDLRGLGLSSKPPGGPASVRRHAPIMLSSMRYPAPCIRASRSSRPSTRTRLTTARGLPQVPACGCLCWRSEARSRSARQWLL
jgi:pimeloyl-ACP methyl ester carboxylesterase